jgi:hypothetical protein
LTRLYTFGERGAVQVGIHAEAAAVERVDDRPGTLGKVTLRIADAGINLTTVYLATGTCLVLGCEDVAALEAAWTQVAASASG